MTLLTQLSAVQAERAADALPSDGLSARQQETLRCLLIGLTERQIGQALAISPHTVHVYVKAIYAHFGVTSRPELLACTIAALLMAFDQKPTRPRPSLRNGSDCGAS